MPITRGNVDTSKVEPGDIHYEYGFQNSETVVKVLRRPAFKEVADMTQWSWTSEIIDCEDKARIGQHVEYLITEGLEHYGPKLYTYKAYGRVFPTAQ